MSDIDADFAAILDGRATHEETKAFLERSIALMGDPNAIAAGARALRARMIPVAAPANAIDVCGTGGDGAHTLNISTTVAFVVAGCGVPVAKHGNRAMSSNCGAADVLEALGVTLTDDAKILERCLKEANVAFLFAQNHHPAMRHAAAARKEIGVRTIFNLLGPLANPARVTRQFVGVYDADAARALANALLLLGCKRALVVHGAGGLDELVPSNGNLLLSVENQRVRETPLSFVGGGPPALEALRGGDADFNAGALRDLLEGRSRNDAYRQIVELNAAAALTAAGAAHDLGEGAGLARESLDEGLALNALNALVALSRDAS